MILDQELCKLTNLLQQEPLTWAIGGSIVLHYHGIEQNPHDIDLFVIESDALRLLSILQNSSATSVPVTKKAPFHTKVFQSFTWDGVDIDVMSGFGIEHEAGIYRCPFDRDSITAVWKINGQSVPICALEEWYILYRLMPGREFKASAIEAYFEKHGVSHPQLLNRALVQPLPQQVQKRIYLFLAK
ncbi:hypothetical protein [Aureibacillus halotolerans]|uniref:Nucleotidyltransferase DUF2204 n=1 Tax=Aureibacillus halotolerans TaxID=1508390 RepID=A0A4R6U5B5_9BACI|nr:hypothetical protein [Aureibacillus halotolerans]TDQ39799.1 hypothetical protein EV213_107167 [Aureibacillus halotolerans]